MGKLGPTLGVAAFSVAGGFIGGLFTAGSFSGVGASIGTMIGGMLFAQPQPPGHSSVSDLKVQRAEPSFLPIVCGGDIDDPLRPGDKLPGGVWLPGLIIATAPDGGITTVPAKPPKKSGGGGTGGRLFGAPKPDAGDEQYLSCAIAWSEGSDAHPQRLVELMADDRVEFSLSASKNEDGYLNRTLVRDAQGREVGWQSDHIRHYYGTETQPIDDVVATWFDGGHAPAFRGCNYTVLVNFRVDGFGHIPTFYGRFSNGVVKRLDQCRFFLERANGLDGEEVIPPSAIKLSKISGQSRGWFMTQAGAPRAIAELVAARSYCALVEHSYTISDVDLANPTVHTLENWELGARDEGGEEESESPRFKRGLTDQISLFSRVDVRFADARSRDENTVSALMPTAQHENTQLFDMPTSDTEEEMASWAQVTLDASWIAGTPGEVSALPRRIDVTAGDVVIVPPSEQGNAPASILVNDRLLGVPGAIGIKGVGWDGEVYRRPPRIVVPPRPVDARAWAKPLLFAANTVALYDEMRKEPGLIVAASQTPDYKWEKGCIVEFDSAQNGGWKETDSQQIRARAQMGRTRALWNAQPSLGGYNYGAALEVEMFSGNLVTAPETEVRGGANLVLFENGLVISFVIAQQSGLTSWGEGIYRLSGIKAGRFGSEDLALSVLSGTRFVLLRDEEGEETGGTLYKAYNQWNQVGDARRLRGWMPERQQGEETRPFVCTGENVKPLSPVGVRATRGEDGSLRLQGRSRLRGVDESGWDSNRVTITEPRKDDGYRFDVKMRVAPGNFAAMMMATKDAGGSFDWTWSVAQLNAILGGGQGSASVDVPGAISGTVTMQGALPGRATVWEQE